MGTRLIDRWTDTTAFRLMLFVGGLVAVPVLMLGLLMTVGLLSAAVLEQRAALEGAVVVFLSIGGGLGMLGYLRAHWGAKAPSRHNVTATLLCLAIGIVTALAVAGVVAAVAIESWFARGRSTAALGLAALFVAAHIVWVAAGVAWMQRLARRYAEITGRAFDGLPVALLFVAVALAAAATLTATAL
jgi:hypothetical protein